MMEIRIPRKLLVNALALKQVKALRLLLVAKLLYNSRANIQQLIEETDTNPKTGKRLVNAIVGNGWAGTDKTYLFPRAWHRIKYAKRGGLYLTDTEILSDPKKFEALAFTHALKKLYRRKGLSTSNGEKKGAKPKDLSLRYVCQALNLKERRCKALRAASQKYGLITIRRRYWRIGKSSECGALRKNIKGPHMFAFNNSTLWSQVSKITFHEFGQILPDTPKERTHPKPETQTTIIRAKNVQTKITNG